MRGEAHPHGSTPGVGMGVYLARTIVRRLGGELAVASLAEWVDLDGCLLLAEDPFERLVLDDDCRWRLGDAPGLGVGARS